MKGLVEDLLLLARLDQVRRRNGRRSTWPSWPPMPAATPSRPTRPAGHFHAPQPVVILGVEAHVRQALGNLVTNAVKPHLRGTAIEVSAGVQGGEAVVSRARPRPRPRHRGAGPRL